VFPAGYCGSILALRMILPALLDQPRPAGRWPAPDAAAGTHDSRHNEASLNW